MSGHTAFLLFGCFCFVPAVKEHTAVLGHTEDLPAGSHSSHIDVKLCFLGVLGAAEGDIYHQLIGFGDIRLSAVGFLILFKVVVVLFKLGLLAELYRDITSSFE